MKGTDHLAEALGIKIIELKDGYCKVSMKVEEIHTNALGFTHGGAIFTLADYAFAQACNFGFLCLTYARVTMLGWPNGSGGSLQSCYIWVQFPSPAP